ncbi:MAG TPA: glycosyltransferase family 4 protein, partial [Patescibacteria group bacterium]|nr:glycosyltransferase family 4 protein [Patescibacteria group bacterium]
PNKQAMLDYLEKILPTGLEIYLFVPNKNRERFKVKKIILVKTSSNKYNSFIELRKFCREKKIDRMINIGLPPYEGIIMAYASLFTKTDFICYHLGNPIDSFNLGSFKMKLKTIFELAVSYVLAIFPKKIFLASENQVKRIRRYLFFAQKRIFSMPATVPTSFFKPQSKILSRKKLNLNEKDKIIIFIGRIGYLKGSDILLNSIRKNQDKKFILIGEIVDKGLKEQIEKNNFKNLLLIPYKTQEELIDYYNASDLCLFPSRIEGNPLVPREAMSCGVPSIVSDIPGTESIKDAAMMVPLDLARMDNAVKNFFNLKKEEIKKISEKSRDFIAKNFDDEVWKERYIRNIFF